MKWQGKYHLQKQPQQIVFALALTSILSLSLTAGLSLMQNATAAPINSSQNTNTQTVNANDRLPRSVADAVIKDLSRREKIPANKLKIAEYSRETWSDGCFGLGKLNQLCAQVIVEGWRVVVSDNRQNWAYRTDSTGRHIALENENNSTQLPATVANVVLKDAAKRRFPLFGETPQAGNLSQLPISDLRIIQAEKQTWPDGCFGISIPNVRCTALAIPGWLVAVEAGAQILIYRTNESTGFRLDEAASTIPRPIPTSQLPQPLQLGVIFRSIVLGGFSGIKTETNLREDGQLIQVTGSFAGSTSQTKTYSISKEKLQQFKQLLEQQKFDRFNGLEYPPPQFAADYGSITLTSPTATTLYYDINQDRLPSHLQTVIRAWNNLQSQQ